MENGNLATKLRVGKARASYAHVFEPVSFEEGGKKKYSITLIISKDNTDMVNKIKTLINNAFQIGKQTMWGGKIPAGANNPLYDGDIKRPDDEAYANCYYLQAKCDTKPGVNKVKGYKVVDGKRVLQIEEITNEDEFYSGCYVYATVNFFPYNKIAKGVSCGLGNILKVEDGESLGSRASAEHDFNDLDLPDEDLPFSPDSDPFAGKDDECPY